MKKRLIALLLVIVTVLGMLPVTASAASSEEEALGEVNIYNGEQRLSYLSINGRIRELIYTYFNYVDSNGRTKEIPAYCVNPNTKGVPQTVGPGESIKYIAKEKGSDPKIMGIIANGYPPWPRGTQIGESLLCVLRYKNGLMVLPVAELEH